MIGDLFAQLSLGVFEIFLLFAELLVPFVEAVLAFFQLPFALNLLLTALARLLFEPFFLFDLFFFDFEFRFAAEIIGFKLRLTDRFFGQCFGVLLPRTFKKSLDKKDRRAGSDHQDDRNQQIGNILNHE